MFVHIHLFIHSFIQSFVYTKGYYKLLVLPPIQAFSSLPQSHEKPAFSLKALMSPLVLASWPVFSPA